MIINACDDPIPMAVMFDWGTGTHKPNKLKAKALVIENDCKLSTSKSSDYYSGLSEQSLEELAFDSDLI